MDPGCVLAPLRARLAAAASWLCALACVLAPCTCEPGCVLLAPCTCAPAWLRVSSPTCAPRCCCVLALRAGLRPSSLYVRAWLRASSPTCAPRCCCVLAPCTCVRACLLPPCTCASGCVLAPCTCAPGCVLLASLRARLAAAAAC